MTKYRIYGQYFKAEIEKVEVIRETDVYVVLSTEQRKGGEFKEKKISDWRQYYDTWAEAHTVLTKSVLTQLENARKRFELADSLVNDVKAMKPPVDTSL